jgi:hypothetical protein
MIAADRTCHRSRRVWGRSARALLLALVTIPAGPRGGAEEPVIVEAIADGVAYLKSRQQPDGSWNEQGHPLGETALAGLALVAGGERRDAPVVRAAAAKVRALAVESRQTYDVSLAAMFLDTVGEEIDSELIRTLGHRLEAGQCTDGSWSYQLDLGQPKGENSNTQFAALACWICRRHGAAIDAAIGRVDGYFRASANAAEGGWGYRPGDGSTASMTCAGLVALAARQGMVLRRGRDAEHPLEGEQQRDDAAPRQPLEAGGDPVVRAALDYLGRQIGDEPSRGFGWGLYFYWSLERVGVIYGIDQIGGVDWYVWGGKRLLRAQKQDGSWEGKHVQTAFAVLFLARANVANDLTTALEGWAGGKPPPRSGFMRIDRGRRGQAVPEADGDLPAPPPPPGQ